MRIPIAGALQGTFVDSGWYGTIVVETEGTNEHLADLQDRCGRGAFPPRAAAPGRARDRDLLKVFRILREKRHVSLPSALLNPTLTISRVVDLGKFGSGLWASASASTNLHIRTLSLFSG